jgi:hypothetical protein
MTVTFGVGADGRATAVVLHCTSWGATSAQPTQTECSEAAST